MIYDKYFIFFFDIINDGIEMLEFTISKNEKDELIISDICNEYEEVEYTDDIWTNIMNDYYETYEKYTSIGINFIDIEPIIVFNILNNIIEGLNVKKITSSYGLETAELKIPPIKTLKYIDIDCILKIDLGILSNIHFLKCHNLFIEEYICPHNFDF